VLDAVGSFIGSQETKAAWLPLADAPITYHRNEAATSLLRPVTLRTRKEEFVDLLARRCEPVEASYFTFPGYALRNRSGWLRDCLQYEYKVMLYSSPTSRVLEVPATLKVSSAAFPVQGSELTHVYDSYWYACDYLRHIQSPANVVPSVPTRTLDRSGLRSFAEAGKRAVRAMEEMERQWRQAADEEGAYWASLSEDDER
jgi:hypothetical protein